MQTVEETVSTWGADIVRGLAHPDSTPARQSRIAIASEEKAEQVQSLDAAIKIVRCTVNNAVDAHAVLCAMSASLTRKGYPFDSDLVRRLDEFSDYLKYGEEA